MISSRFLVSLLLAGAIALACGPRLRSTPPPDPTPAAHAANGQKLANSLDVSVRGGVKLVYHVTNISDSKLEIDFPNGQTHDFVVLDDGGREVWRWSKERIFTQAFQSKFLDEKETMTIEAHWDAARRTGKFTAVAQLLSSNHPLEQRVEFTLP